MFDNIDEKIKGVATANTCIGTTFSCIWGLSVMINTNAILMGLLIIVCGSLFAWISSFVLYGFGQLIADTGELRKAFCKSTDHDAVQEINRTLDKTKESETAKTDTPNNANASKNASDPYGDCKIALTGSRASGKCNFCNEGNLILHLATVTDNRGTHSVKICDACIEKILAYKTK